MASPAVRYRVWVGGLPASVQRDDLVAKFSKYGAITDVVLRSSERDTYAFITYLDRMEAEEAIAKMDRSCAWGAPVKVNISKDFAPNGPRRRGPDGKPLNELLGLPSGAPVPPPADWRSSARPSSPRQRSRSHGRGESRRGGIRRSRSSTPRRRRRRRRSRSPDDGGGLHAERHCSLSSRKPRHKVRGHDRCDLEPMPLRGGHGRGGSPPRPPSPRGRHSAPPARGGVCLRSPGRGSSAYRGHDRGEPRAASPPVGEHRVIIEHLPDDMGWLELKELGLTYGRSVTFSRTFRRNGDFCGMVEYAESADAQHCISSLDGRRMQDGVKLMRVYLGQGNEGAF